MNACSRRKLVRIDYDGRLEIQCEWLGLAENSENPKYCKGNFDWV